MVSLVVGGGNGAKRESVLFLIFLPFFPLVSRLVFVVVQLFVFFMTGFSTTTTTTTTSFFIFMQIIDGGAMNQTELANLLTRREEEVGDWIAVLVVMRQF